MTGWNSNGLGRARPSLIVAGVAIMLALATVTLMVMADSAPSGQPTVDSTNPSPPPQAATDSVATTAAASAPTTEPPKPEPFDADRALNDIRQLERLGPRKGGSAAEKKGSAYVAGRLTEMGYSPEIETFELPNGKTSRNVIARAQGTSTVFFVFGAHMDSKPPSPGANDNLSGCGVLLEIARNLSTDPATPTVEFVFFGSEEILDGNPDHHHAGSRHHVSSMTKSEKLNTAGMVSVDMVGYGSDFTVRTMNRGPQILRKQLLAAAKRTGVSASYVRDPGKSGWSDHEAFELAGIPAAWVEWSNDPAYHTARDVSGRLQKKRLRQTGQLMLDFTRQLDDASLAKLLAASEVR